MLITILVCASLAFAEPPVDHCDSLTIEQARDAVAELDRIDRAHASPARYTVVYEGTMSMEAHMMRPGMVLKRPTRIEISASPGSLAIRERTGPPGSTPTETMLARRNRVIEQKSDSTPFKEPAHAAETLADAGAWLPGTIITAARGNTASCRITQQIVSDDKPYRPISFSDAAGRTTSLIVDSDHHIARIERIAIDQRLGDVCNWTQFTGWETRDGAVFPQKVSRFLVLESVSVRYDLTLSSIVTNPGELDVAALPTDRKADVPDWDASPAINFTSVAPTVWAAEIPESNSRAIIVERDKDLFLFRAPDGDRIASQLLDAIRAKFNKPVAIATFGHHHPSPSGGLRAIAASGATIIAPRSLEDHIQWLLSRPTTLGPPAVTAPRKVAITYFDGETTIDCGTEKAHLIDIGERSAHAFAFTVMHLQASGILVEDDLGYFPSNGAAKASPRLIGLVDAMHEKDIHPKRIIQTWPLKDVVKEVDWPFVEALVKDARK